MACSINRSFALVSAMALLVAAPAMAGDHSRAAIPRGNPASWFPYADYPAAAKRAGLGGRVAFGVMFGPDGRPTACRVVNGSGSAMLDQETCQLAMAHAVFVPALDAAGDPIASSYLLTVIWASERTPVLPRTAPLLTRALVEIDPSGRIVSCRPDEASNPGAPSLFDCAALGAMPASFGYWARGDDASPGIEQITVETGWSFSNGPRADLIAWNPDRAIVGASSITFEVGPAGKPEFCRSFLEPPPEQLGNLCARLPAALAAPFPGHGVSMTVAISRSATR